MNEIKKKNMSSDSWQIWQITLLLIAGIMELYEVANKSKTFSFVYKTILILMLIGGAMCGIKQIRTIADETRLKNLKDSIYFNQSCIKNENNIKNYFNSQRENISGQLTQLGFKIDSVSNRIVKINQTVISDSTINNLRNDNIKIKKSLKNTLAVDFN